MAFAQLEPFGAEMDLLGHAVTASTVANVNRPKNRRAYKVEDFMPKFGKRSQSVDEMIQWAEAMTIGLGGEDKRNG